MKTTPSLLSLFFLGLAAGCNSSPGGAGAACGSGPECGGGLVCLDSRCVVLCSSSTRDCGVNEFCNQEGLCESLSGNGEAAVITNVTSANGTNKLSDGRIVVTGQNLQNATFEILSGSTQAQGLTIASSTATQAVLELPTDVASGTYTLSAMNQAGGGSVSVTLEMPDVTPAIVMERLNQSTGTININRLPLTQLDTRYDARYAPIGSGGVDPNLSVDSVNVANTLLINGGAQAGIPNGQASLAGQGRVHITSGERTYLGSTNEVVVGTFGGGYSGNFRVEGSTTLQGTAAFQGAIVSPNLWAKINIDSFNDAINYKFNNVGGANYSALRVKFRGKYNCNNNQGQRVHVRLNNSTNGWSTAYSFNHGNGHRHHGSTEGFVVGNIWCYQGGIGTLAFEYTFDQQAGIGGAGPDITAYGSGTYIDPGEIRKWEFGGGAWGMGNVNVVEVTTDGGSRLTGTLELWGLRR